MISDADIDRAIREACGGDPWDDEANKRYDRAIYRAGVAAGRAAMREEAAGKCDEYSQAHWHDYKHGVEEIRGNPYIEGKGDGADECADAIRALKDA